MTSEAVRAREAGYVARMDGRPYDDNPHITAHLIEAWAQGWRQADRELLAPKVRALTERKAEADGWAPMDMAPKDGTWFIAVQDGETYPCQWAREEPDEGAPLEGWYDLWNRSFEAPEAWAPQPALPARLTPK